LEQKEARAQSANLVSSEEEEFEHSVPLDEAAKKALAAEQSIADVLRDEYGTRRAFVQLVGQHAEPIHAEARAWIWQRWQAQKSAYVRVSTNDDDGEQQDCLYFIDNNSENGGMQVTLKIHRIVWDQDSPSGPRYKVTEDQILIANQIRRTEPSVDDSQAPRVFSEKEELPASKYRLHFLSDGTFDLLTL
jgi:hypothetical protein